MDKKYNLYIRRGNKVYIRNPEFKELSFVEKLWGCEENMKDIGGAYSFPKKKWEMFYKKMVYPTDGKNFFCLIYDLKDNPVGEVSFHGYNSITKVARINVKIDYKHRGRGYASEALKLLLEYYFWTFGGEAIIDSADTKEAKRIFEKLGFEIINKFKDQVTYKLDRNKFAAYNEKEKRDVYILCYDNMNILDYSIAVKIFITANKVLNNSYFNIYLVSNNKEVQTEDKIFITVDKSFKENVNEKSILIIPGTDSEEFNLDRSYIIDFIKKEYLNSDYILLFSKELKELENIFDIEVIEDKNLIDYGKIIIARDYKENINACINIIRNILGEEIASNIRYYFI
ncbi:GNAT family N-acetyltransferase [Caproiciproducens sp. MSJ-32]|uniref:GNAT family N-acetyltransferase n=1 Tax=Caproiciproducens sp. MSJ-32 TaxID=2841527 RepID=UPI001C10120D|nr:GNAT family N-acetyltransferase [Caproiciproducens sp. MSJ-32]MBU5455105.1 GNAT family N-acetyltransferase [Caproiciproducens sp. MSJ-32]